MDQSREKVLETILVIAAGLLVFYLFTDNEWLVRIPLALIIISLISGWIASKIHWLWYKLAEVLGRVNGGILLSIVFFVFLFPLSLMQKLFSKSDKMGFKKKQGSYFVERNHTYQAKDLKNPW